MTTLALFAPPLHAVSPFAGSLLLLGILLRLTLRHRH